MLTLNEDLFDDVVEIEIPDVEIQPPLESPDIELTGPDPGQATGEASLILNAISDCAKTIDNYNMMKSNLSSSEAGNIIDEIASEETVILGKLQALLKQVSPNAECIPDAIEGAEEVLGESLNEASNTDIERVSDKLDSIIDAAKDAKDKFNNGTKNDLSLELCLGSLRSIERNLDTLKKLVSGFHDEAIKTRNKEFGESLNEENNEVRTVGIYGDEVKGFSSLNSLVNYFKDKGLEVTDVDGDMDYGWEMNLTGNPRKLFFAVVNTIPGYNSDSVQDFIDEYSIDESLKEDTVLYSGSWRDEGGNWQPSTLQYKGFRLKVSKDNLISIYDKHGELVDSGFKTKKSAVDAIDSGKYDGLNESKLNEGDWEDPEWRKYYGVDDDSFYDDLPVELEPEETFTDIDDTFEESFKETSKFLDPITHKLKVEAWEPVEQSQEEPNKIDDQIPDDMEVDDEF